MLSLDLLHFPTLMSLINLDSILTVYHYCVPVQMAIQMAMGAVQVCVSLQTFILKSSHVCHWMVFTALY